MECKEKRNRRKIRGRCVLIETLWNVKMISGNFINRTRAGINRNIVECKDWKRCNRIRDSDSINRNIVECKGCIHNRLYQRDIGINRNIVECKEKSFKRIISRYSVLIETLWNVKSGKIEVYIERKGY